MKPALVIDMYEANGLRVRSIIYMLLILQTFSSKISHCKVSTLQDSNNMCMPVVRFRASHISQKLPPQEC